MRIVAILAVRNERRFISSALDHLTTNQVEVYLIDNESSDSTVEIAKGYLGRGLLGIESLPYGGFYDWTAVLHRKEELARQLDADWFMHVDADEIHASSRQGENLRQAFERVDAEGFNAVNFQEFTFVPTREAPDHDHPHFKDTMRHYYPFSPGFPRLIRAWKAQPHPMKLAWSGGHFVDFPGLRLASETFIMRHYLFLSALHAREKYSERVYSTDEVAKGWHGWRARIKENQIVLPDQRHLRFYTSDAALDWSNPRTKHFLEEIVSGE